MNTLLQIAQIGNPILRKKALPVPKQTTEIANLIDSLLATMNDSNSVGIAAPQVYQSFRIIVVTSRPTPSYPQAPTMSPTVMINPNILSHGEETEADWEGCLSIPGIRGKVPRWKQISLRYLSKQEEIVSMKYEGFIARIIQHEIDHLDGILFTDRMTDLKTLCTEKEFQKLLTRNNAV